MENMLKNQKLKNSYETLKYKFTHSIKGIKKKVLLFVDYLNNTTEADLINTHDTTLTQQLQLWFVEIIQYGLLLSIVYNWFFGWQGQMNIVLVFVLGISRWFIFDCVKSFKEI